MTAHMSAERVSQAQKMRDEGVPVAEIAAEFGVTGQTIRNRTTKPVANPVTPPARVSRTAPLPQRQRKAPSSVAPEPPKQMGRWRVVRSRSANGGRLGRGWFATDGVGSGAWFPSWPEAWSFALANARREDREALESAAAFGLMKIRGSAAA